MVFFLKNRKENYIENRPWGNFEILNKTNGLVIKKITVNPQKRLSYQAHEKRAEHWYIIEGAGKVTINNLILEAKANQSFDIARQVKHRIENTEVKNNLVFIEISTGNFDENDIIRYQDDFNRI